MEPKDNEVLAEAEAEETTLDESTDNDGVDLENADEGWDDEEDEDESEEESEDDGFDEETEEESDTEGESEEEEVEETETPEEELSDEEKRKQHNREMAERRIQEKRLRDQSIQERQDAFLRGSKNEEELALRNIQVEMYNNRVEKNTNNLTNSYEKALQDFPILRDASPEIQRELDSFLDAFQAQFVKIDEFGNPLEVHSDLYRELQAKADSIQALTGKGARQQAQSKAKEKSKALPTPVRVPKQPKKDEMMDGFDEEAGRY